jgi:hypothetical protein
MSSYTECKILKKRECTVRKNMSHHLDFVASSSYHGTMLVIIFQYQDKTFSHFIFNKEIQKHWFKWKKLSLTKKQNNV